MTKDNPSSSQTESEENPIVLGRQFAEACQAETKWQESMGRGSSLLPETEYDPWRGDYLLLCPTLNGLDEKIQEVCRQYALSSVDERSEMRHSVSMDQFYTLINFAKRVAVFGLRENNVNLVADGLTAIAMIEKERVDYRDILLSLSLLYYAANKTGGDADEMFHISAKLAESEVAELLVGFTEQTPEYRDLRDSWGYVPVETNKGVGFIGWGFSDHDPSIDLISTIIDILELVTSDDYQPDRIEVATELPDFWVGGQQNAAFKYVFSSIRGGATLSASLRPDKYPEHDSQQFTVFLVETAKEADAKDLCQMVENNKSQHHHKLALAKSRLFCLVVARSFVEGVDAYETSESLTRFLDGLAVILKRHTAN